MKRILKIILFSMLGLIGIILITLIIAFFALSGDYNPGATVEKDKNLPQIKLNNINFHCETFGSDENEAIIVLHGGPGLDYKNLLALSQLADEYHLIFFDMRGSGLSERVSEDKLKFNYFLNDLNSFVEYFAKNKKINIVAHSWGGILATAYITKYPEKVNKLVLAEPGSLTLEMDKYLAKNNGNVKLEPSFKLLIHLITCWLKSLHIDGPDEYAGEDFFINSFITDYSQDNHPLSGYYCNKIVPNALKDNRRFGALASKWTPASDKSINNYKLWQKDIKNFDNEVLFIVGECDSILGEKFQSKQMTYFRKAELISIPDAGHQLIAEQSEASIKAIRNFLNK